MSFNGDGGLKDHLADKDIIFSADILKFQSGGPAKQQFGIN